MSVLTPHACRAARALLQLSVRELGEKAGVGFVAVSAFENGRAMRETNKAKLVAVFEAAGVEILNGDAPGARMRPARAHLK
jgi:transcriptional regulator with XRE-family HTH domain